MRDNVLNRRGLTLIEVLIASVLLSMMSVVAMTSLRQARVAAAKDNRPPVATLKSFVDQAIRDGAIDMGSIDRDFRAELSWGSVEGFEDIDRGNEPIRVRALHSVDFKDGVAWLEFAYHGRRIYRLVDQVGVKVGGAP